MSLTRQTALVAGQCYSLEDHRGFLVCVEPAGHKGFESGRAVATRSRPGPWERIFIHGATLKGSKGKSGSTNNNNKKKNKNKKGKGKGKGKEEMDKGDGHTRKGAQAGDLLTSTNLVNLVSVHNTAFQVDDSGLVQPGPTKHAQGFFVEYHAQRGSLALRTADGRYLGTTKAGKLVCNRPKKTNAASEISSTCFFRVFERKNNFDDPRNYLPLGVHPGAIAHLHRPQPTFEAVVDELCGRFLLSLPNEELQVVSRLFFQIEQMWWFYEDHEADLHQHLPHMDMQEFGRQIFRLSDLFEPVRSQYDSLYKDFKSYLSKVPVFGVFVMNGPMTKVVLVKSYNGSRLGFPRGKVNQDEGEVECAIREAREEIGIDLTGQVDQSSYIQFPEGKKTVKLFLVAGTAEDTEFETQTRKEIRSIGWYDMMKAKGLIPTAQWKQLKAWINSRKKAHRNTAKNQKKHAKEAARQAKEGRHQKKKNTKNPNWKDGWGIEDMLSGGVIGGGGRGDSGRSFVDEDDQPKMVKNLDTAIVEGSSSGMSRSEGYMKGRQNSRRISKRKAATSAWKVDEIFQGKQRGQFKFDKQLIFSNLDANLAKLGKGLLLKA